MRGRGIGVVVGRKSWRLGSEISRRENGGGSHEFVPVSSLCSCAVCIYLGFRGADFGRGEFESPEKQRHVCLRCG